MTPSLILEVACDRPLVAAESSSQRLLEWTISAASVAKRPGRLPLNLALVLDRSGSMRGPKLDYVQQAACYLLDHLDDRDRVAVVAYDDEVTLLAKSQEMTAHARAAVQTEIKRLRPGGRTDLSGGWLQGCQELADHQLFQGVNRSLLLTDGLANQGITDPEELAQHARELRRRGISTSTFGVGLDFNEHLLTALAEQGGGHFFYIERPAQIPDVFRDELGELLTVVAREASLTVAVPDGVTLEVIGDIPHERYASSTGIGKQDRMRLFLGDLSGGERRRLYMRVLTPPDRPGSQVVLKATLQWAATDTGAEETSAELAFSYARDVEVRMTAPDAELLERASDVEVAAAASRALKLDRQGQRGAAQAVMQEALASNVRYLSAPAAAGYEALAHQMQEGLSEKQHKDTQYAAYRKRNSRG